MVDLNPHMDDLDENIYDRALVTRYRLYTSRIKNFKVKDEFDSFVENTLNILADITLTKTRRQSLGIVPY